MMMGMAKGDVVFFQVCRINRPPKHNLNTGATKDQQKTRWMSIVRYLKNDNEVAAIIDFFK